MSPRGAGLAWLLAAACSGATEGPTPAPARVPPAAVPHATAPAAPPTLPAPEPIAPAAPAPVDPPGDAIVALRAAAAPHLDGRLDEPAWQAATPVPITTDWRGEPSALETVARFSWSEDALFFSFDCAYEELVVDEAAPTATEHESLYRFDAVEVFLDPDPRTPATYVELEVGPRGHFLDVAVDRDRRPRGDVAWSSGMNAVTDVDPRAKRYRIEARVPAAALGRSPLSPGELRIGVYRLAGRGDARHYLARFPTGTPRPNFHVPERFGRLVLR